jgi:hypothetical protein
MGANVIGVRLAGKVDHLPGAFFVATRFFHLGPLPLVPLGSWLVIEGAGRSPAGGTALRDRLPGLPVPWSLRSVAWAWGRALLVCLGAALVTAGGAMAALTPQPGALALPLTGVALLALAWASLRWNRPSSSRAAELLRRAGFPGTVALRLLMQLSEERRPSPTPSPSAR